MFSLENLKKKDLCNIIESREDQTIYIGTFNEDKIDLKILSNNLQCIGVKEHITTYDDFLINLNYDNEYVEVQGKLLFHKRMKEKLVHLSYNDGENIVIPVLVNSEKGFYKITSNKVSINGNIVSVVHISNDTNTGTILENLYRRTYKDFLTGLFNRHTLEYHFSLINFDRINSFIYIDINKFKNFNDVYGHVFGDNVLIRFSEILINQLKSKKYSEYHIMGYRVSGDEFLLYTDNLSEDIIKMFLDDFSNSLLNIRVKDKLIDITYSFGIYVANEDDIFEDVIKYADKKMYEDKNK